MMAWLRGVSAVVIGYVVSQALNAAFVYYWYFGDRSLGAPALVLVTLVFFAVVAVATGYLVGRVAAPHGRWAGSIAGALIAAVTVGNILADVAAEPLWHKLVVLLLMAPALAVTAGRVGAASTAAEASPPA
ncbi:MAG: hypothetical protein ACR2QM_13455 [Longimicrobiales bacterium]